MSAEFTMEPAGGGSHSPAGGSHSKKGFKISKPMLYIGGGLIIILFLVISRSRNSQGGQAIDTPPDMPIGYPSNSTDVAGQLQNNADIINGQVQAQLDGFQAQMSADYGTQLTAIQNKLSAMQPVSDGSNAHPNPGTVIPSPGHAPAPAPTPSKPTPAPAKAPPKPAPKPAPAPAKPAPYTIKKGDTLYSLAKKNGTTVSAIAKANGIKDPNKIIAGHKITLPPKPAPKKK